VPVPRTHYQVTFTARQGVLFFAVCLAALAGAYFLGVATGYSGRPAGQESDRAGAASPSPTAVVEQVAEKPVKRAEPTPKPAPTAAATPAEAKASPPAIAAREPTNAGGIQFFEDQEKPEETPAPGATPKKAVTAAPAAGGYWVQVLSTTSEPEANKRRMALASKGYRAAVSPVHGAKGPALYRVRIGPYGSREEASKASEALVRKEKVRTWIVSPGE